MKKIYFSLFWILFIVPVFAGEYYVDAENGSNDWSGTSPDTAWKTVERVNVFRDFQPGDTIRFKAGCVWRESLICQSGAAGKPLTYTSYGEGPKPVFYASENLCEEKLWEPTETPNVWRAVRDVLGEIVGPLPEFAAKPWTLYCESGAQATLTSNPADGGRTVWKIRCEKQGEFPHHLQLNNTPFSMRANQAIQFRFRARASQPMTLDFSYLHLLQSSEPWATRARTLDGKAEITTTWQEFAVCFITTAGAEGNDNRMMLALGKSIPEGAELEFEPLGAEERACTSAELPADVGNIVLVKRGETEEYAAWKHWSLETLKRTGDFFYQRETQRLYFYATQNPATLFSQMEAAMKRNCIAVQNASNMVLDGLAARYTGAHGVGSWGGVHDVGIRNCDFRWIGGSWHSGPSTRYGNGVEFWSSIQNVVVEGCFFSQVYDTAMTNQGPDAGVVQNVVWQNNRAEKCEQVFEIWFSNPEMRVKSLTFRYNECVDTGFGWSHAQRPDKRATHILGYGIQASELNVRYEHNQFGNTRDAMVWYFNDRLPEVSLDHNTYTLIRADAATRKMFRWGDTEKTFDEYRAATGFDSHSTLQVLAKNYYVDADNGLDENDGTTPETAWKTVDRVTHFDHFQPGDVIHFKAGCMWREGLYGRSGSPTAPVVFTRYGDGPKPAFWQSTNFCDETLWEKTDRPNVWRTISERVPQIAGPNGLLEVGNIVLVKQGETEEFAAWKRWKIEDLKATGDFYYDPAAQLVYFYAEPNPASLYTQMEAAMKRSGIALSDTHFMEIDGLEIAYSGAHGACGHMSDVVIRNCNFRWVGGSWLYTRGPIPTRYGNGVELWSDVHDILVEGCTFFQIYDTAMTNQGGGAGEIRHVVWRKNRAEKCEQVYEVWFSDPGMRVLSLDFEENECLDTGMGWSHAQRPDKTAAHILGYGIHASELNIRYMRNVFGKTRDAMIWYFNDRLPEVQIDQNTYLPEDADAATRKMFRWGKMEKTYDEYRAATGFDQNSTFQTAP